MTQSENIAFPTDDIITGQYLLEIERLVNFCSWHWEPVGKKIVLSATAAEVTGVTGNTKGLKELLSIVEPADRGFVIAVMRNMAMVKHTSKLYFGTNVAGVIKHFFMSGCAYYNKNGRVTYYGFIQNITENRELVTSLKAQNKQLSEISWLQSHRVRSPLATILGLIDLLETGELTEAENIEMLAGLKQAGQQLDNVIRTISNKTDLSEL